MLTNTARPAFMALAAMTLLTGCANGAGARYATDEFAPTSVAIEVANHNWMDVTVYAVSGGVRSRLGQVSTGMSQVFRMPRTVNTQTSDFRLEADPVGAGEVYTSHAIQATPGTRIIWSLENELALSSFRIASAK